MTWAKIQLFTCLGFFEADSETIGCRQQCPLNLTNKSLSWLLRALWQMSLKTAITLNAEMLLNNQQFLKILQNAHLISNLPLYKQVFLVKISIKASMQQSLFRWSRQWRVDSKISTVGGYSYIWKFAKMQSFVAQIFEFYWLAVCFFTFKTDIFLLLWFCWQAFWKTCHKICCDSKLDMRACV